MNSDKKNLLRDLLNERREATLLAGGRVLRRKRWVRRAWQSLGVAMLLGCAAWPLVRLTSGKAPTVASVPVPAEPPSSLTDEELLALFPDTPVGLATMADGKKRLVFPRAGDEEKFIMRL